MWKSYLENIQENSTPSDTININVKFVNSELDKEFIKGYNLHASNFKDLKSVKDLVIGELAKLNEFDSVVDLLKPFIGKEIK